MRLLSTVLINPVNRQSYKQTDKGENITSMAEVSIPASDIRHVRIYQSVNADARKKNLALKTKIIQRQKHNVLGDVRGLPHFEHLIHIHLSLTQETPLVQQHRCQLCIWPVSCCHLVYKNKLTPFIKKTKSTVL